MAKNFTKVRERDVFGGDIIMENATDFVKQLTELRANVLTNTQREHNKSMVTSQVEY